MILVKATTGKGTAGEITIKTPVFIHCSGAVAGVTVNYTPFVFQVNPRTGGSSVAPTITGTDLSTFIADYRRTFNYYNINGPAEHKMVNRVVVMTPSCTAFGKHIMSQLELQA